MRLIDITSSNWEKVILLTTNPNNQHTLDEEFVASNTYSIVESIYEADWTIKAVEEDGQLVGFAMYGLPEGSGAYELRRFMIDRKFQGRGYGKQALALIIREMEEKFACKEIYLSTEPGNSRGKHVYESQGFVSTGELQDGEEVYVLRIN
ncbi:GNAT family N-acetyltransferase [Paenibacillus sp. MMS20-IR301]|uniref:GNAT family N-acetyltransferase n=1 Tax=Paenibacillus sp. MMS20-IR301 TaxID=2895946 RepID=UPI0028EEE094|nr:GNAT family N-acetyltransferase [Paenibacillus sp. MMS20-IR301]WNS46329.1 GNAT family N-acetyltransferase [Paenibacillus sp. MMS20-IR301]